MESNKKKYSSVDQYIADQQGEVKKRCMLIRDLIVATCPDAVESISYGMPAYKLHKKPLIYFGVFSHHIGLYATPSAHSAFAKELLNYKQGKGSVQFSHDQPLPLDLIERMLQYKMKEVMGQ